MAPPFVMHETVSMIPGEDVAEVNGQLALSARGVLKMLLCVTREESASPEGWIRIERFQDRVSGMLAARSAMTGEANLDALLEEHFVPKIRSAGNAKGAAAFMEEIVRTLDTTAQS